MIGFDRFEALKKGIVDGKAEFIMMLADFHLQKGGITQEQYDELNKLSYPTSVEEMAEY
ncbi:hypothetical protein [Bacteroides sp.]|uniref:hypothetical protein n=1 Tax=Bacteroides sp. TaxID=29523 RepID=UPI0026273E7C|nr:hypothetical protein [Bacteroides sp.]MDD3041093.1 hypothetical protein [Bacteroides sp.]